MKRKISLKNPYDMHIHFREGDMLNLVAPLSARFFAGGVIMPNLIPPVDNLKRLLDYTEEVNKSVSKHNFSPFMTLFFKNYDYNFLESIKEKIIGIKLYPAGATTNSDDGVQELKSAEKTLKIMEELNIPLLVHGETHGFVMDRESEFLDSYIFLANNFPKLKITMEHITTAGAVELLNEYENLFATVTLQHLVITLDDVAGGLLQTHNFCKPIAKRPEDREKLLETALNAHPKLMFGSDSAPHPIDKKEASHCSAGCFTAPIALPYLAQLFDEHNKLDNLQRFVSDNAVTNYKLYNKNFKVIELIKEDFIVPKSYGNVVPFEFGKTLKWNYSKDY